MPVPKIKVSDLQFCWLNKRFGVETLTSLSAFTFLIRHFPLSPENHAEFIPPYSSFSFAAAEFDLFNTVGLSAITAIVDKVCSYFRE